jgi:predicted hydrocarbon binding protein
VNEKPGMGDAEVVPQLDLAKGELRASTGEDWVLISGEALRKIYEMEAAVLQSGAFVIWYNAGKTVGTTEGRKFAELINDIGIDQLAKELSKSYSKLGWGFIKVGEIDLLKNEVGIIMRNSPMVRGVSAKEPRCWYVRGFMEGMISSILGAEATAFELACEAVNGDHCEFKVAWKLAEPPGRQ